MCANGFKRSFQIGVTLEMLISKGYLLANLHFQQCMSVCSAFTENLFSCGSKVWPKCMSVSISFQDRTPFLHTWASGMFAWGWLKMNTPEAAEV